MAPIPVRDKAPITTLMAGAAQVLMRNLTAGHAQGRSIDRTPLDGFVREHLATDLMHMSPQDGLVEDTQRTWALANSTGETVLLYSAAGPSITLLKLLPHCAYSEIWFDPRTGATRLLDGPDSWEAGTTLRKPTGEDWLLLLKARR